MSFFMENLTNSNKICICIRQTRFNLHKNVDLILVDFKMVNSTLLIWSDTEVEEYY